MSIYFVLTIRIYVVFSHPVVLQSAIFLNCTNNTCFINIGGLIRSDKFQLIFHGETFILDYYIMIDRGCACIYAIKTTMWHAVHPKTVNARYIGSYYAVDGSYLLTLTHGSC